MDYNEEGTKIALELFDKMILAVTPDDVIAKTDELVRTAVDMDLSGAEKFEWVLGQIKPLLWSALQFIGERLVQLVYELAMEYADGKRS